MKNFDEFEREHMGRESSRAHGRMIFCGLIVGAAILAAVVAAVYAIISRL